MTNEIQPPVLCTQARDGITVLTLNRPAKLNALSYALVDALIERLRALEADPAVRAVILTGAGQAFSAGADIGEFRDSIASGVGTAVREFCRRGQRLTRTIEDFPKPVIAAVNGLAFGGGCEIVEASHLAIAAQGALFGKPEIKLGIVPTFGGTQRLPRLAGRKRALHAILCGDPFVAHVARDMGLINEVVASEALLDAALDLAQHVTRHAAVAVAAALIAVTRGLNVSVDEGLRIEALAFGTTVASGDALAGATAFLRRRAP